jgi:3-oxoacyl-[acyl-carrier protein] reductase
MIFKDKIALVTGGSRGIGKTIVDELNSEGATVYFTYLHENDEILNLKKSSDQSRIFPRQCDVKDFNESTSLINEIWNNHKQIDFIVNNAGITNDKMLGFMTLEEWNDVINTNLNGVYNICRNVILKLMKKKSGKIINITSIGGITGVAYQTNYSASKAGVIGFTKSLAREVASLGITVNAIAAGYIETDMLKSMPGDMKEKALKLVPLGRFGKPKEVAHLVSFLLSEKANYITGEVIKIDGGIY